MSPIDLDEYVVPLMAVLTLVLQSLDPKAMLYSLFLLLHFSNLAEEVFLAFEMVKVDVRNGVEDSVRNLDFGYDHRSIERKEEVKIVVDAKKEAEDRIFDHPSNVPHDYRVHPPDLCLEEDNVIEGGKADNSSLASPILHYHQHFLYANYLHDGNDCSFRWANVERNALWMLSSALDFCLDHDCCSQKSWADLGEEAAVAMSHGLDKL